MKLCGIFLSVPDLFNVIFSRFIDAFTDNLISIFLRLNIISLCICVYTPHVLYLPIHGYIAWLYVLAFVNDAATNT